MVNYVVGKYSAEKNVSAEKNTEKARARLQGQDELARR